MTLLFWLMAIITGLCAFASSLIAKNGAWIFFVGYFLAICLCSIVAIHQKQQGGAE